MSRVEAKRLLGDNPNSLVCVNHIAKMAQCSATTIYNVRSNDEPLFGELEASGGMLRVPRRLINHLESVA